jgi:hypothetical protein
MAACVWAAQSERSGGSLGSWREQISCKSAGCISKNMSCVLTSVQCIIVIPFSAFSATHFHTLYSYAISHP